MCLHLSPPTCLPIYRSFCPSFYQPVCPCIFLSVPSVFLAVHLCIYLSVILFICQSIPVCQSIWLFLSVPLPLCPSRNTAGFKPPGIFDHHLSRWAVLFWCHVQNINTFYIEKFVYPLAGTARIWKWDIIWVYNIGVNARLDSVAPRCHYHYH